MSRAIPRKCSKRGAASRLRRRRAALAGLVKRWPTKVEPFRDTASNWYARMVSERATLERLTGLATGEVRA